MAIRNFVTLCNLHFLGDCTADFLTAQKNLIDNGVAFYSTFSEHGKHVILTLAYIYDITTTLTWKIFRALYAMMTFSTRDLNMYMFKSRVEKVIIAYNALKIFHVNVVVMS